MPKMFKGQERAAAPEHLVEPAQFFRYEKSPNAAVFFAFL